MNTPAHILIGLGLLGERIKPNMAGAIILGSFAPDAPAFIFYIYEKFYLGTPEYIIWSDKYFQPQWNYVFDAFHSIPLSVLAAGIFIVLHKKWASYFFISILLHCLVDLAVHHTDAHRHFLPFTDYRFLSPISYWDTRFYGQYVMSFEVIVSLAFATQYLIRLQAYYLKYVIYAILTIYIGNILMGFYYW